MRSKLSVPPSGPCWLSGLQSWSVGYTTDLTLDRTPQKPEPGQDYIRYSKNIQTKGTKLYCWPTLAKATLSELKRMLPSVKGGASFRDWTTTEKRTEVTRDPGSGPWCFLTVTCHNQSTLTMHMLTKLLYNTGDCSHRLQLYVFWQWQTEFLHQRQLLNSRVVNSKCGVI